MTPKTADRIEVVDALRGIALFAIVIVHCLEHYNLYYIPDDYPQWLTSLDKGIWNKPGLSWREKPSPLSLFFLGSVFTFSSVMLKKEGFHLRADLYGECFFF